MASVVLVGLGGFYYWDCADWVGFLKKVKAKKGERLKAFGSWLKVDLAWLLMKASGPWFRLALGS